MTSGAANALGVMAADQRSDGGSGVSLAAEILALVAQHGDNATVDYPAVFILLNTVAGGYYQERFGNKRSRPRSSHCMPMAFSRRMAPTVSC